MSTKEKDKIHHEIAVEGAEEADHLHHETPWYYHTGVKFLSVVMAIMFVMWIFAGFPIGGIIRGQLESTELESGVLKLDNFTIEFEESVLSELLGLYYENQATEFSVCLLGEIDENILLKDKYLIDELYVPVTYLQSYSHVSFESCNSSTIIMLHTHPYKSCVASQTDLDTLESSQVFNQEMVMLVMCEPERFSVYG
jgi:hypothetical protein